MKTELQQALALLELPETVTLEDLKTRWRDLAKELHPDAGGDPVKFGEFNRAYKIVVEHAGAPVDCPECGGSGRVPMGGRVSFSAIMITCPACNGSCKVPR
jgi:DnaJ-class molecular chaperone